MQNTTVKTGFFQEIARRPSLLLVALGSFLLMGLGQLLNRQWLKGLVFLLVPFLLLTLEFSTGSWDKMEAGYRSDTINYFGKLMAATADAQSTELSNLTGKSVSVADPVADVVDASTLGEGHDYGTVLLQADLADGTPHGWVLGPDAASALFTPAAAEDATEAPEPVDPTDAQLTSLAAAVFPAVRDALAAPLGQTLGTQPVRIVKQSESQVDLTGPVVRVRYDLIVDSVGLGTLVEYFPQPLALKAVGDDPHAGETLYPARDYGGYISRGLWGMFTLGSLVVDDDYRGVVIQGGLNVEKPWASADSSSKLLARGLIATVLLALYLVAWVLCVADAWTSRKRYLVTGHTQSIVEFAKELWDRAYVWILIAPAAVVISFFTIIPFLYTFLCGFTDWTYKVYDYQQLIHWKGFDEYASVFGETAWLTLFLQVFGWTVIWAAASSATVYVMGFAHALVVESPLVKGKRFWRTIIIIPWALPAMISLLAFRNVFDKDGLMNQILLQTGLMEPVSGFLYGIGLAGSAVPGKPDEIIFWFDPPYNANLAKAVAIGVNMWLGSPYFMMLIIGIIATIPADRYEAAMIDGANAYQRFRYITLPMVVNATVPAMVMTVTFNFNNFGAIYFLNGGAPKWPLENLPDSLRVWFNSMPQQSDILISWIYRISFTMNSQLYNKAAVYTVFIFLILGVFSVINMKLTKALDDEGEE